MSTVKLRKYDVYEEDDREAAKFEKRFKDVGVVDEEMGEDFEDEEVSEDEAFDESDDAKYGDALRAIASRKRKVRPRPFSSLLRGPRRP